MNNFLKNILDRFLTVARGNGKISKTSEISTQPIRETEKPIIDSLVCPYCSSKKFVRRGFRQKKMERIQLYLCQECGKTFTSQITKGKHYPLKIIFDAISLYSLGYSMEETCRIVNLKNQSSNLKATTLSNWLNSYSEFLLFNENMREYALKLGAPKDSVITATLAHRQLYNFRFHRIKCNLIIREDIRHRNFGPLAEFLEMVPAECPHQYFQEGLRASEAPLIFSKRQMIVRAKQNYATKLTSFILQSAGKRARRHEAIQKFMLANDTVTVATEVPVYLTKDDLDHMRTQLGFEIFTKTIDDGKSKIENYKNPSSILNPPPLPSTINHLSSGDLPKLITGHIDILQIRNGQIHILDYKPEAAKFQPIEQLTLYAMALSRLTGLRLFEFKCAWFDEKDYFEFYPLHVLHKPRKTKRRRKIYTMEGIYKINANEKKFDLLRPIKSWIQN